MIVETELARERVNNHTKTIMSFTQSAIASALSKKAASAFNKDLSEL